MRLVIHNAPRKRPFLKRLKAGWLPLGTSCLWGAGFLLFWTVTSLGAKALLAGPCHAPLEAFLGTGGLWAAGALYALIMRNTIRCARKGIHASARRFRGPPIHASVARGFAFLLLLGFFGLLFFLFRDPVSALLETIFQYVPGLAVLIPLIILLMTGMPS